MSNTAIITITTSGTTGDLNDIFVNTNPTLALQNMQNFLSGVAGGSKHGTVEVDVYANTGAATGTLTCATVADADTVTIGNQTFTAVDKREKTQVTTRADSTGDLNSTYFVFYNSAGTKYYMWYNVNAAGVDPTVASGTGIEVALATDATANTVASASRAKFLLSPLSTWFTETGATDKILFQSVNTGAITNTADGAAAGATTFTIATTVAGGTVGTDEFQIGSDAVSATNLVTCIAANAVATTLVTASTSSGVVTLTATAPGTLGNTIILGATGGITESGSLLSNGTPATSTSYSFG